MHCGIVAFFFWWFATRNPNAPAAQTTCNLELHAASQLMMNRASKIVSEDSGTLAFDAFKRVLSVSKLCGTLLVEYAYDSAIHNGRAKALMLVHTDRMFHLYSRLVGPTANLISMVCLPQ